MVTLATKVDARTRSAYLSRIMFAQLTLDINEPILLEYRFHETRRWRLDLAIPDSKIGIEIHGGIWARGRHIRGAGFAADREKMNEAQALGWDVYEFIADDVENGIAAQSLVRYYKLKKEREA